MEIKTKLLPYQVDAVEKLIHLKVGALYMEMGTGKTRTALELISRRIAAHKAEHVIWLCPCSCRRDLRIDIRKHTDGATGIITICGIETLSTSMRTLAALQELTERYKCILVVDESNLVKNPQALRSIHITQLSKLCPYRLILNGTPISKNEADLFSQWRILDWRILGYQSFWSFAANHLEYDEKHKDRVRRVLNVDYLTDKIAPYMYQIKKTECLELPQKKYVENDFILPADLRDEYCRVRDMFLDPMILDMGEYDPTIIYRTFNALQQVASGRRILSTALQHIVHEPFYCDPEQNPRIQETLLSISRIPDNEKIVIWCKFSHEIFDLQTVLERQGEKVTLFYGGLSRRKREESLNRFETTARILLANKTCAGYGLNLQYCHHAIYYNNDWDWATRAQSEDRLHRIGQTQDVKIVDICAIFTIDDRILECVQRKEGMVESFKQALKSKTLVEWLSGKDEVYDSYRIDNRTKRK